MDDKRTDSEKTSDAIYGRMISRLIQIVAADGSVWWVGQ